MSDNGFQEDQLVDDVDWGCQYIHIKSLSGSPDVKLCFVNVSEITKVASKLTESVQDTSWIMDLDSLSRMAYRRTAEDTIAGLVKIFNLITEDTGVKKDFGELLVSMGSTRALELVFNHSAIPISEIWKSKTKNNDGFDFHTICSDKVINFGEAKFSSSSSKFSEALRQSDSFLEQEKHLRDIPHLINFFPNDCISNSMCSTLYGLFNSRFSMLVSQSLSDSGNQYQNVV